MTYITDPLYFIASVSVRTDRKPNTVTIDFRVVRDIEDPLYLQITVKTIQSNNRPQMLMAGPKVDMCKFFLKTRTDPLMRGLLDAANKYGNRINKCPVQQMQYNITDMPIRSDLLPSFMPAGRYLLIFDLFRLTKPTKYVQTLRILWIGDIVRK